MRCSRSFTGAVVTVALILLSAFPLAGQGRFGVTAREVQHHAAAFDPGGRLTIVWSGPDTTGQPGLFARRYERTGVPLGSEMRVGYGTAGQVSVAPLAAGGFAAAWTTSARKLVLRRFSAAGEPLGPATVVASNVDPDGAIHALPAGGFLAVWTVSGEAGRQNLFARRYSSTGTPRGGAVTLATFAAGIFDGVTVGPGASLLVTWKAAGSSVCGTMARRYSLDGQPLARTFAICTARSSSGSARPVLSAGPDSFVTTWEGFHGIYMRRLRLDGTPLGPTTRVDTESHDSAGAYSSTRPQVAHSPGGAFVVLWNLLPCKVDCHELHYSRVTAWSTYAPAGALWSDGSRGSFQINCEPGEEDQELVSGPGNLFAAAWVRNCWDEDTALEAVIFSAAPPSPPPPPPAFPGGRLSLAQTLYAAREEQGSVAVRVRRTGGEGLVSIGYSTSLGSARPDVDYVPVSGRLVWRNGDFADKTVIVPILADGVTDTASWFGFRLTAPAGGAGLSSSAATVYIDSPGFLGFPGNEPVVLESAGRLELPVQRLGGDRGEVSVRYFFGSPPDSDASPGLAMDGEDFLPVAGTLHWEDGDSAPKTISVPILDDDIAEDWEGFSYALADPAGGARLGIANSWIWSVIEDDEISLARAGRLELAFASPLTVEEGAGRATVSVRRAGGMAGRVSVRYTVTAGTAKPGLDFTPVSGVLVWGDSDLAERSFAIPILADHQAEGNETVKIELSAPTGGAALGIPSAAVLVILDDDP